MTVRGAPPSGMPVAPQRLRATCAGTPTPPSRPPNSSKPECVHSLPSVLNCAETPPWQAASYKALDIKTAHLKEHCAVFGRVLCHQQITD